MSLPKDLDEFLHDFDDLKNPKLDDHAIARQFKNYLQKQGLNEEIIALRFLISTQRFHSLNKKNNNNKANKKDKEMKEIFLQTGKTFFDRNNDDILYLSDEKLWDDLVAAVANVQETNRLTETEISLLERARRDPLVRQVALDPKYMTFIKTQPNNAIACLLSIL